MARKRMFDLNVVDTDSFLDLPVTAQNLYFHSSMRADDDGFVSNIKRIMDLSKANKDDMNILIAKGFFLLFEDGVIVIRHWRLNNYIRKDRYIPTVFQEKKKSLNINSSGIYNFGIPTVDQMATNGIPSIEENSIVNSSSNSKEEINKEESIFQIIEEEFGRTISSMEYEVISSWDYPLEILKLAVKEAVTSRNLSLKYIDKIIFNWKSKGFKSVADVEQYITDFKRKKRDKDEKISSETGEASSNYYKEF